jgi:hypothetical protein
MAYLPEVAYKSGGFTPSLKIREANFFLLDNIRDVKRKEKTNCWLEVGALYGRRVLFISWYQFMCFLIIIVM